MGVGGWDNCSYRVVFLMNKKKIDESRRYNDPPPESEETKMINFYDVIEYCKHLGKSGKILKLVQSHIV